MTAKRLSITGRVQGVGYRDWTVRMAKSLGLTGWVRNRKDGSVEALVEGDEAVIDELAARCRQGPPAARVDDVVVTDADPEGMTRFEFRHTV